MKKTFFAALCLAFSSGAFAQSWPTKPIRVLVAFAPKEAGLGEQ